MNFANKPLSDRVRIALWAAVVGLIALVSVITTAGCAGTVAPRPVPVAEQASFDGNEQNSGIVMSVPSGFVVTDHFRLRYNAMIATYGGDFSPALQPDYGVAPIGPDRWLMTKAAVVYFLEMNAWRRAGVLPIKP